MGCCDKIGEEYEGIRPDGWRAGPCEPCDGSKNKCCEKLHIPGYNCLAEQVNCCPHRTGNVGVYNKWEFYGTGTHPTPAQGYEAWESVFYVNGSDGAPVSGFGGPNHGGGLWTRSFEGEASTKIIDPWEVFINHSDTYWTNIPNEDHPVAQRLNLGVISITDQAGQKFMNQFGMSYTSTASYWSAGPTMNGLMGIVQMVYDGDVTRCDPSGVLATTTLGETEKYEITDASTATTKDTWIDGPFTTTSAIRNTLLGYTTSYTTGGTPVTDGAGNVLGFSPTTITEILPTYADTTFSRTTQMPGTQGQTIGYTFTPKVGLATNFTFTHTAKQDISYYAPVEGYGHGSNMEYKFWEPVMSFYIAPLYVDSYGQVGGVGGWWNDEGWRNSFYYLATDGTNFKRIGTTGAGGTFQDRHNGFTKGLNMGNQNRWGWVTSLNSTLASSHLLKVKPMTHEQCRTLNYTPEIDGTTEVEGTPIYADMDPTVWENEEPPYYITGNEDWSWSYFSDNQSRAENDGAYVSRVSNRSLPPSEKWTSGKFDYAYLPSFPNNSLCPSWATDLQCAKIYAANFCDTTGVKRTGPDGYWNYLPFCCSDGETEADDDCVEDCTKDDGHYLFLSEKSNYDSIDKFIKDQLGGSYRLADYSDFFDEAYQPTNSCRLRTTHNGNSLDSNAMNWVANTGVFGYGYLDVTNCGGFPNCGTCYPVTETDPARFTETPVLKWEYDPFTTTFIEWIPGDETIVATEPGRNVVLRPDGTPSVLPHTVQTNFINTNVYQQTRVTKFDYGTRGTQNPVGWTTTNQWVGLTKVPATTHEQTYNITVSTAIGARMTTSIAQTTALTQSSVGYGSSWPAIAHIRYSDWCVARIGCNYDLGSDPFGWNGNASADEMVCGRCNEQITAGNITPGGIDDGDGYSNVVGGYKDAPWTTVENSIYRPHFGGKGVLIPDSKVENCKKLMQNVHSAFTGSTIDFNWLDAPETFYRTTLSDFDTSRCCPAGTVTGWKGRECGNGDGNWCVHTGEHVVSLGTGTGEFIGAVDGAIYWDDVDVGPGGTLIGNKNTNYNFKYKVIYTGDGDTEEIGPNQTDLGDSRFLKSATKDTDTKKDATLQWVIRVRDHYSSPHGEGMITCPMYTGCATGNLVNGVSFEFDYGSNGSWGAAGMPYIRGLAGLGEDDCVDCCDEDE